jgi:hypothetical protein
MISLENLRGSIEKSHADIDFAINFLESTLGSFTDP